MTQEQTPGRKPDFSEYGANLVRLDKRAQALLATLAEGGVKPISDLLPQRITAEDVAAIGKLMMAGYVFEAELSLFPSANGIVESRKIQGN